ncbi:MAG: outer membrane protein assembly factor BamD [Candidatus Binataceae bacterium]|nr:outer membrane protein assembly factor BamD [Candidatus Binataceae bacterium]
MKARAPGRSRCSRWMIGLAACGAAVAIAGCAPTSDVQQLQDSDSNLRGIIANDHQEIADLQEKVGRLNDTVTEMQHGGEAAIGSGGKPGSLKARVAHLESEVAALQPAANAAPPGIPVMPGIPSAPGTIAPGAANTMGMPMTGGADAAAGAGAAMGANTDNSANSDSPANAASSANSDSSANADNNSSDNSDSNDSESAAGAPPAVNPPPPAPEPAAAPPPDWHTVLNQELAAAQSSTDPAAKYYRAGLAEMRTGSYAGAIGKFQALQHRYPKSPLSEPAEFFSANALYELGKYDDSILQYNDLVMRFPKGRFASASLLSEAQSFMKIGDRIDARLTLQKLLSDHPASAQAPTARAMMSSLANG